MGIKTHKDLDVWNKAMDLAFDLYNITKDFPREEVYGLTSQIRRSAVSIASNIAEGAARNSKKEFIQFLYISLGSIAELETQILLAKKLNYLKAEIVLSEIDKIRQMTLGLINYLKKRDT
ncbi:MAG: four helix bundle protein [Thermodesulfovibrionales bacterium]|nr:four helix bundle protein [Thermodesulfovibrionales bacterium]